MDEYQRKEVLEIIEEYDFSDADKKKAIAKVLEKRQAAAREIGLLEKERNGSIPKLRKALAEKEAEFRAAQDVFERLKQEVIKATTNVMNASDRYEREIGKLKDALLESSDERIGQAVQWFNSKLDALRKAGIKTMGHESENNIISLTKTVIVYSNQEALLSAMSYCQHALKLLEKIRFLPELDVKMIEDLKKNVPCTESVKSFKPMTGKKDMERPASAHVIPADTTTNYILKKLHEKADKILYPYRYKKARA